MLTVEALRRLNRWLFLRKGDFPAVLTSHVQKSKGQKKMDTTNKPCTQFPSPVKVLLINQEKIPHYRVPVYNYLREFLNGKGFTLTVACEGIEEGAPSKPKFVYREMPLRFYSLVRFITDFDPCAVIFWVNVKYTYLFPVVFATKILKKKVLYWGHGRDLEDLNAQVKNLAYAIEHWVCDAIILYAENLKKYVLRRFHHKVFIANNTLNLTEVDISSFSKELTLAKYNIRTKKNIICMGRMQRRKRIDDLVKAFSIMDRPEYGLILVGPDTDGVLRDVQGTNIYKMPATYGAEGLALLSAADVFCLPGHIGLSIVDAMHCGLPIVTENVEHAPEIMYLKDGINGFIVEKGNVRELAGKLQVLLADDGLRERFARAAKNEISTHGHIETMCRGFGEALRFVIGRKSR